MIHAKMQDSGGRHPRRAFLAGITGLAATASANGAPQLPAALCLAVTLGCALLVGCEAIEPVGVLVNHANVTKTLVGKSSPDLPFRRFVPGSFDRIKRVDVVGDTVEDALVESDDRHGVDIQDGNGPFTLAITTPYFVTDFAPVPYPTPKDRAVVVATYPDENRGSSFTVFSLPDGKTIAAWQEYPPIKGFIDIGHWERATAVFYIHEEFIVIRTPDGTLQTRLPLPGVTPCPLSMR